MWRYKGYLTDRRLLVAWGKGNMAMWPSKAYLTDTCPSLARHLEKEKISYVALQGLSDGPSLARHLEKGKNSYVAL